MSNESKAVPDYESECEICGISPVVIMANKVTGETHTTCMCGVCLFGESECVDPEKW